MSVKRGVLPALAIVVTFAGAAMGVEMPPYQEVLRDGDFELRDYPALVVAEVTVQGTQKEAGSRGFRLLAGYIFGANRKRQGIAMAAPVAQQATSEKIAMTAPVAQTQSTAGTWVVRFTMPRAWTLQTLPIPDDSRVMLRSMEAARYAVLRFSGLAQADDVDVQTRQLRASVAAGDLRPVGDVTLAQYNPPWTLWFLRRNEVMVEVTR